MERSDLLEIIKDLKNEEIVKILENSESLSDASMKLFETKSTLGRTIIKQLCDDFNVKKPDFYNRKNYCLFCGKEILGRDKLRKKFCNHSCAASYNNGGRVIHNSNFCLNCGKEINYRNKFCCNKCQFDYEYKQYIEKWKNGKENGIISNDDISNYVVRYMREKYYNSCQICGWHEVNQTTGKVPLQIHHVDGDCLNNKEENLQLLCPNCHSLTETFGALNKGNSTRNDKRLR